MKISRSNLDPLTAALEYAKFGLPVLPIHPARGRCSWCKDSACSHPGKHLAVHRGLIDATLNAAQIRAWWRKRPDLNVAIRTGRSAGIVVLDIDNRNGGPHSFKRLIEQYGNLPVTVHCRSGSGGLHLYFAHPRSFVPSRNSLLPGIDVRGEGGYVIAPPSLHENGQRYTWIFPPGLVDLAPMPRWLQGA